tara:strand:- start:356 stop:988 length:633 start_codon:yes stop_codon:yes gene_type:complete
MSYTLYGHPGSGSCIIELTLNEIGVDYQVNHVSLNDDSQRGAVYAAVNPQRKLPTLVTDTGETLTESAAILLTLEERHAAADLLPPVGSEERARALRWLLFVATEVYPIVEINDYPDRFTATDGVADATRELARKIWRKRLLVIENSIDDGPYVLGTTFSMTDIYIAVVTRWAQQEEWRPYNVPKIENLTATVASREKLAPIWAQHFGAN